jgi:hypothetical protein
MNMNKIYEFVAVGMVLCILCIVPTVSAQATTVTIADASADHGLTTTTEIRAHNVEHLTGFTITLEYDPTIVMVVDEEINPIFGMNVSVIANNATGSVILGSLSMTADVTSDDVLLATVTLRADGNPPEQSVLNITVDALINTTNDQIQPRSEIDGTFTIGAAAVPTVSIGSAECSVGGTVDVPINITGASNIGAMDIRVAYDTSVLTATGVANGTMIASFPNVTVAYNIISGGVMINISFATYPETVNGDGEVFVVTFDADAAGNSTLDINVTEAWTGDAPPQSVMPITVDGYVNVTGVVGLKGDVDGDGVVTGIDAMQIKQHIVGLITLTPEQLARGDINCDGVVTGIDAMHIKHASVGLISQWWWGVSS